MPFMIAKGLNPMSKTPSSPTISGTIRVQKLLSILGISSRREAETWIAQGRIGINGKTLDKMGEKINLKTDSLYVDGKKISLKIPKHQYFLLNKPKGYLCSHKQQDDRPTIFSLEGLKALDQKFFSAGRLDYSSEGLLIISNDGEFIHRLTHPSYKLPRRYLVYASHRMPQEDIAKLRSGQLTLDDGPVKKVLIDEYIPNRQLVKDGDREKNRCWYMITVYEGKNRLVRRIFEAMHCQVFRLIRVGFADIALPKSLKKGDVIPLSSRQVTALKKAVQLLQ